MLGRGLAGVVVAVLTLMITPMPASLADGDGTCTQQVDPQTGQVKWVCEDGGGTPGGGGDNPGGGSSTCSYQGHDIPCSGPEDSVWNSAHGCYVGAAWELVDGEVPPPPDGESADGGAWRICYYPPPTGGSEAVWIRNGETAIDPVVLANRAIASMDLDAIEIGIVPESAPNRVGLVGLPVWMWVDQPTDDTFGPITASASEGTVSVSATANVSSIVWDMGDGTEITCTGRGTPYADHYGKQASPTCGHRYAKVSADQPDGAYQVTATSHWVVEWTGGGQSGTIEYALATEPLPIRVGEAQVLTQ